MIILKKLKIAILLSLLIVSFDNVVLSNAVGFEGKIHKNIYVRDIDISNLTREEAKRRWNLAKETKRRMVEKLEALARESYKEQTGEYPVGVEVW